MLKLRINKFIELAKMSHLRFQQKPDVRPEEITITTLDEQFIKQAIGIVEANMGDSDFSVEALGQAHNGQGTGRLHPQHTYEAWTYAARPGPDECLGDSLSGGLQHSEALYGELQDRVRHDAFGI